MGVTNQEMHGSMEYRRSRTHLDPWERETYNHSLSADPSSASRGDSWTVWFPHSSDLPLLKVLRPDIGAFGEAVWATRFSALEEGERNMQCWINLLSYLGQMLVLVLTNLSTQLNGCVGEDCRDLQALFYMWSEWIGDNMLESEGILNFVSEWKENYMIMI